MKYRNQYKKKNDAFWYIIREDGLSGVDEGYGGDALKHSEYHQVSCLRK